MGQFAHNPARGRGVPGGTEALAEYGWVTGWDAVGYFDTRRHLVSPPGRLSTGATRMSHLTGAARGFMTVSLSPCLEVPWSKGAGELA